MLLKKFFIILFLLTTQLFSTISISPTTDYVGNTFTINYTNDTSLDETEPNIRFYRNDVLITTNTMTRKSSTHYTKNYIPILSGEYRFRIGVLVDGSRIYVPSVYFTVNDKAPTVSNLTATSNSDGEVGGSLSVSHPLGKIKHLRIHYANNSNYDNSEYINIGSYGNEQNTGSKTFSFDASEYSGQTVYYKVEVTSVEDTKPSTAPSGIVNIPNTNSNVPSSPPLRTPEDGETVQDTSPTLNWSYVTNTTYFKVALEDMDNNILLDFIDTEYPRKNTPYLIPGKTYKWTAKACNDDGCSVSSPYRTFTIQGCDDVSIETITINPMYNLPFNIEDEFRLNITMKNLGTKEVDDCPIKYYYGGNSNSNFGSAFDDDTSSSMDPQETDNEASNHTSISYIGTNYVKVCLVDEQDNDMNCKIKDFTVSESAPAKPTLDTPNDNSSLTDTTPTLSWSSVNDATYYRLYLYDSNNDSLFSYNYKSTATTSSITPLLTIGETYKWAVQACNDNICSDPAENRFFTIISDTPIITSLTANVDANALINGSFVVSHPSGQIKNLRVHYANNAQYDNYQSLDIGNYSDLQSTGTKTFSFDADNYRGQTLYYKIEVSSPNGIKPITPPSSTIDIPHMPIPSIPTLTTPNDGASFTDATPTLNWNNVDDAIYYKLLLTDSDSNIIYNFIRVDAISKTTTTLATGKTYHWAVQSCNYSGCSTTSNSQSFSIAEILENQAPYVTNIESTINTSNGDITISFDPYDPENLTMGADIYLSYPNDTSNFNFDSKKSYSPSNFTGTSTKSITYTRNELVSLGIVDGKSYMIRVNLYDNESAETKGYSSIYTYNYLESIDGQCGTADNHTFTLNDTEYTPYTQCRTGTPSNTTFPTVGNNQIWTCLGLNGGSISNECSSVRSESGGVVTNFYPKEAQRGVATIFTVEGIDLPETLIANIWGTGEHCEKTHYSATKIKFNCTAWAEKGLRKFHIKDSQETDTTILYSGSENWYIDILPEPNSAPSVWIENVPNIVTLDRQFTVIVKSYDPDANLVSVQADWEANNDLNGIVNITNPKGQDVAFSYTRSNNDLRNLKIRFIVTDSNGVTGEVTYTIPVRKPPVIQRPTTGLQNVSAYKQKANQCEEAKEVKGNPISPASGAKIEIKPLLVVNGVVPIAFAINYNSLVLEDSTLGIGWGFSNSHTSKLVEESNGDVTIYWSSSQQHKFTLTSNGSYTSESFGCRLDTLMKQNDGTFKVKRRAKDIYIFDKFNFLKRIENHKGQGLNLKYDEQSRLIRVTEPISAKYIEYTYNNKHLTQARTSGGNTVSLIYTNDFLTTIVHTDDLVESFTYSDLGQIVEHSFNGDLVSKTSYDELGRAIGQEDAKDTNQNLTFDYNETDEHIITKITDRLGNISTKTFNKNYQLIYKKDEMGNEQTYIYNDDGKAISITDGRNNTTNMEYNQYGDITKIITPDNAIRTYEYDSFRNLTKIINADNKERTFTYDSNNNLLSSTDELGNSTTYNYDDNNQLISQTTPETRTTNYGYTDGLQTNITSPKGDMKHIQYDLDGRIVGESDYLGNYTTYELDETGRKISQTDSLGNKQTWTYSARGNLTLYKDAKNSNKETSDSSANYIHHEYDEHNKKVKTYFIHDETEDILEYLYDGEDRLVKEIDPNGNFTLYERDALGRVIKVYDSLNNLIKQYEYDENSNIVKELDAFYNQIISTYDVMNRVTQVKDPLNHTNNFSYDKLGRLTQTTDALSRTWQSNYNDLSQLLSVNNPGSIIAKQSFDKDSNLVSVTTPSNDTRTEDLDENAKVSTETTADNVALNYQYNANNLLTNYTNGRGETTTYTYDTASRLLSANDILSTINYTYDKNSNPTLITEGNLSIGRKYDGLNRVIEYTEDNETLKYTFKNTGDLYVIYYPLFKNQINYISLYHFYDSLGRLDGVADLSMYRYDKKSRLTHITRGNGSRLILSYDNADRLIQSKDFDIHSNIISEQNYTYDAIGRLVSEEVTPEYSPPKELLQSIAMSYGKDNRLFAKDGKVFDFDGDGNILSTGTQLLEFNTRDELVKAGDYNYTYNAEGHRIKRTSTINGVTKETSYLLSPDNMGLVKVLKETTEAGIEHHFAYGAQGLLAQHNSDDMQWYYFHYDYRGSVIAVSNGAGEVVARYGYLPYGQQYTISGSFDTPFGYNGRDGVITDPNGLIYMRARYYSPEQRRFVNKDPLRGEITDIGSLNRYAYVGGDPVNKVDPSGKIAIVPIVYACIAIGTRLAPVIAGGYHATKNFYLVNAPLINATAINILAEAPTSKGTLNTVNKVLTKKTPGSYILKHASGKVYVGKGYQSRAIKSAKEKSTMYNDPVSEIIWKPANSHKDAFIQEFKNLSTYGGKNSPFNYNKIQSPGFKKFLN